MGRKPASGLVGLLLVGGLLTGCNKCCRQGCWGGDSIQDTPPTFGAVGDAGGGGESWGQNPRRHTAVGEAPPAPSRRSGVMPVGRQGAMGMPPAPSHGPSGQDIRTVGAGSADMGGIQQAGFESDPRRVLPPPPSSAGGVNTEAHRPDYAGNENEMGAAPAEMNAGGAPRFDFPPAPVSRSHEESAADTGDFASSPPPPSPPGGSVEDLPEPAEPVGVPPETIHEVPGGVSEPAPVPPPFPPGN